MKLIRKESEDKMETKYGEDGIATMGVIGSKGKVEKTKSGKQRGLLNSLA